MRIELYLGLLLIQQSILILLGVMAYILKRKQLEVEGKI